MRVLRCLAGILMLGVAVAAPAGAQVPVAQPPVLRGALPEPMIAVPSPMLFKLGRFANSPACGMPCAQFIYASGEIRPDTAEALMILQARLKRPLPVYLNSPGGNLDGSLALGRTLRKNGSNARVATLTPIDCRSADQPCNEADQRSGVALFANGEQSGTCNSACVYAFAGGAARTLSAGTSLGVHRYFLTRADDPQRRPLQRLGKADAARLDRTHDVLARYLTEMGISTEALRIAANVEPQDIRHLTTSESARLRLISPPSFAVIGAGRQADPITTGSLRTVISAPDPEPAWPMVTRAGRQFLVLSQPSESRRFGRITTEVAISCTPDGGRYALAFRELIVSRPDSQQDARVRVAPDEIADLRSREPMPSLLRDTALKADDRGVLVLEITSSATAGHPTRIEFPGRGLRDGIERLDRACGR